MLCSLNLGYHPVGQQTIIPIPSFSEIRLASMGNFPEQSGAQPWPSRWRGFLIPPRRQCTLGLPSFRISCLPAGLTALHHGSVLLLEALLQPGGALQVLVHTAHDALLLAVDERLGGEVINTVVKAALDHLGVHL